MNDQDAKIRRLLHEIADEVPLHHTVPPSIGRRAHRQIVTNSVVVGTLIVALGAGVFGVSRAFRPAAAPTKLPFSSGAPTVSPCTAAQLHADGAFTGAAGSRVGGISLLNEYDQPCTLSGRGTITLFSGSQQITSGVVFVSSPAQWQADASSQPIGWPVVTLQSTNGPGDTAFVRIGWSNWCLQGGEPSWRVEIPGSGTVNVMNSKQQMSPPPCNGPTMPSTIEVGPFEPRPAQ